MTQISDKRILALIREAFGITTPFRIYEVKGGYNIRVSAQIKSKVKESLLSLFTAQEVAVGCRRCGARSVRLHPHHVVARSKGGRDERRNLRLLCHECHADLHDGKWHITLIVDPQEYVALLKKYGVRKDK